MKKTTDFLSVFFDGVSGWFGQLDFFGKSFAILLALFVFIAIATLARRRAKEALEISIKPKNKKMP